LVYRKYAFIDVDHHKRTSHRSGYSNWKLFKLSANIVIYYTAVPLRIMTYGGFILSILSFILGIRFIISKLVHDVPLGYTSLIVAILFSTASSCSAWPYRRIPHAYLPGPEQKATLFNRKILK